MTITNEQITNFADSRETSVELAQAILEHTYDHENDCVDLAAAHDEWENAYDMESIVARAWELAAADENELFWGEESFTR